MNFDCIKSKIKKKYLYIKLVNQGKPVKLSVHDLHIPYKMDISNLRSLLSFSAWHTPLTHLHAQGMPI